MTLIPVSLNVTALRNHVTFTNNTQRVFTVSIQPKRWWRLLVYVCLTLTGIFVLPYISAFLSVNHRNYDSASSSTRKLLRVSQWLFSCFSRQKGHCFFSEWCVLLRRGEFRPLRGVGSLKDAYVRSRCTFGDEELRRRKMSHVTNARGFKPASRFSQKNQ